MKRERMVVVTSYVEGETYGLLGPQLAAGIIQENSICDCIVVAVTREDDKNILKKALHDYFGDRRPVMGFSYLAGRTDLFSLAREFKEEGAFTILAGPQADVDFVGEKGRQDHPHYFQGLSSCFSMAVHGPAEQIIPFLNDPKGKTWREGPGILFIDEAARLAQNTKKAWQSTFLRKVIWNNLFRVREGGLEPVHITMGQVLQHIGCPHAARSRWVQIDYPAFLGKGYGESLSIYLKGCSFCDVAVDKGFHGSLDLESVLAQIHGLPERADGRKITFELINENAVPSLPTLLREVKMRGFQLSQVNLTLRADWFILGEKHLREALLLARDMGIRIFLGSMGFESFDDRILSNLNKGVDLETNLRAIGLMRRIKEEFPLEWGYTRDEGANHGFIHPTPWDSEETEMNNKEVISLYAMDKDILPEHSIPLIIHHASALGDWIRAIEKREEIRFKRDVSIITWWQIGDNIII
jgi:hypothetical protein